MRLNGAKGQTLKYLTVVGECTRKYLASDVAGGIRATRAIEIMSRLTSLQARPEFLVLTARKFPTGQRKRWSGVTEI